MPSTAHAVAAAQLQAALVGASALQLPPFVAAFQLGTSFLIGLVIGLFPLHISFGFAAALPLVRAGAQVWHFGLP